MSRILNRIKSILLNKLLDNVIINEIVTKSLVDVGNTAYIDLVDFDHKSSDPGAPTESQMWYNSTDHVLRYRNNTETVDVSGINTDPFFRDIESYTHNFGSVSDNDSTFVTVLEISSGRGILVSIGAGTASPSGMEVRITIDGGTAETDTFTKTYGALGESVWETFTSSLLVEMRNTASCTSRYWAIALTE